MGERTWLLYWTEGAGKGWLLSEAMLETGDWKLNGEELDPAVSCWVAVGWASGAGPVQRPVPRRAALRRYRLQPLGGRVAHNAVQRDMDNCAWTRWLCSRT